MSGPLEIKVGEYFTLRGAPGEPVTLFDGDINTVTFPSDAVRQFAEALLAFTLPLEGNDMKKPQAVECRSCRALIFFAVTPAGRKMPVNAAPDPAGTLIGFLTFEGGRPQLHVDTYRADEPKHQGRNRWTSHFSSCPGADGHRRER